MEACFYSRASTVGTLLRILSIRQKSSSAQFVKLGHSWGSFLGIQVAARAPDRFHAYNSAHSPLFEEPLRAREILRRDVLAQQVGLADATP